MEKSVFKTYDIRGVYPSEINGKTAYLAARAFATLLKAKSIVVGRDGRESSPLLFEEVCRGITDSGVDVVNIGLTNTPLLNFTVTDRDYDGGIMITASHNPPQFNGMKLIKKKALQVYGEEIQKIRKIAEKEDFQKGKGKIISLNPLPRYINHVVSFCLSFKEMRVVIDCANGVAGVTAKPLFKMLPIETIFMNEEVDGSFPNYEANPQKIENLRNLQEKVVKTKADLGVFFDGDGDRSVMVDKRGGVVSMDTLLALLSEEELLENKGEKVYYDLRFSRFVKEKIKEYGGVPVIMRVGNPFYKEKLILEGGVLGAELSGHVMFKENNCIDDGLFALIKTLNLVKKGCSFKKEEGYYQSEEINLEVKDKRKTLNKAKERFKEGNFLDIDGVYVEFKDWWFSLRESNTENLVRLRIEANTEELLEEKRKEIIELIRES